MDIQLGYWRWKLFRWNDHPNPFRNRSDYALEWLRKFEGNQTVLNELRTLLETSATGAYTPFDTQTMLRQIAAKMSSGEIHACPELCGPVKLPGEIGLPATEPEPDLTQLRRPAPPPAATTPAPAPESTLADTTDPAATAQALKAAARDGTPFCAECEKARQAQAPVQE